VDGVIVFSEDEKGGIPNKNTYVTFTNFIDFDHFKKERSLNEREFELGFVGRFEDEKGVIEFAKSAQRLVAEHSEVQIKMIGDGSLFKQVESIVGENDRILLSGWVKYEDLPNEFNDMKLIVLPSKSEALPTVLLEGMGCGTIPVTTKVGSIGEVVTESYNGFYLDGHSAQNIELGVQKVLEQNILPEISDNARETVLENYSEYTVEKNIERVINEIISN
jgi:glycosyltransferase involved in cell wall biosynthesis